MSRITRQILNGPEEVAKLEKKYDLKIGQQAWRLDDSRPVFSKQDLSFFADELKIKEVEIIAIGRSGGCIYMDNGEERSYNYAMGKYDDTARLKVYRTLEEAKAVVRAKQEEYVQNLETQINAIKNQIDEVKKQWN